MAPTVEALKRLIVAIKDDDTTVDDVPGVTIPEVIDELTKAYTAANTTDEEE